MERGVGSVTNTTTAGGPRLSQHKLHQNHKWHLDEVFIRIKGELHFLWRAVDQNGIVLDILVQSRRDAGAAKRFFRRLTKGLHCSPP